VYTKFTELLEKYQELTGLIQNRGLDDYCCPDCGEDLTYDDSYGYLAAHRSGEKIGDIYRCQNEECNEYGTFYHNRSARGDDELKEGHPC